MATVWTPEAGVSTTFAEEIEADFFAVGAPERICIPPELICIPPEEIPNLVYTADSSVSTTYTAETGPASTYTAETGPATTWTQA